MTRTQRMGCIVIGIMGALLTTAILFDESMRGFPDSHLTDFDRAIGPPRKVLSIVTLALSIALMGVGIRNRTSGKRTCAMIIVALAVVFVVETIGLDFLFSRVLQLDHGQGG